MLIFRLWFHSRQVFFNVEGLPYVVRQCMCVLAYYTDLWCNVTDTYLTTAITRVIFFQISSSLMLGLVMPW